MRQPEAAGTTGATTAHEEAVTPDARAGAAAIGTVHPGVVDAVDLTAIHQHQRGDAVRHQQLGAVGPTVRAVGICRGVLLGIDQRNGRAGLFHGLGDALGEIVFGIGFATRDLGTMQRGAVAEHDSDHGICRRAGGRWAQRCRRRLRLAQRVQHAQRHPRAVLVIGGKLVDQRRVNVGQADALPALPHQPECLVVRRQTHMPTPVADRRGTRAGIVCVLRQFDVTHPGHVELTFEPQLDRREVQPRWLCVEPQQRHHLIVTRDHPVGRVVDVDYQAARRAVVDVDTRRVARKQVVDGFAEAEAGEQGVTAGACDVATRVPRSGGLAPLPGELASGASAHSSQCFASERCLCGVADRRVLGDQLPGALPDGVVEQVQVVFEVAIGGVPVFRSIADARSDRPLSRLPGRNRPTGRTTVQRQRRQHDKQPANAAFACIGNSVQPLSVATLPAHYGLAGAVGQARRARSADRFDRDQAPVFFSPATRRAPAAGCVRRHRLPSAGHRPIPRTRSARCGTRSRGTGTA